MQRAGFPMAIDCGGTSFVTTVPAEITDPEPMVIPGAITAPCAIQTSSPMLRGPFAPSLLSANRTIGATIHRKGISVVLHQWSPREDICNVLKEVFRKEASLVNWDFVQ
jgi:hypothetical protein